LDFTANPLATAGVWPAFISSPESATAADECVRDALTVSVRSLAACLVISWVAMLCLLDSIRRGAVRMAADGREYRFCTWGLSALESRFAGDR
jgi:hypothetical protein